MVDKDEGKTLQDVRFRAAHRQRFRSARLSLYTDGNGSMSAGRAGRARRHRSSELQVAGPDRSRPVAPPSRGESVAVGGRRCSPLRPNTSRRRNNERARDATTDDDDDAAMMLPIS